MELGRWLNGLEHLLLFLSTHIWWLTTAYDSSSRGLNALFWFQRALAHIWHDFTKIQTHIYTYINKIKDKNLKNKSLAIIQEVF